MANSKVPLIAALALFCCVTVVSSMPGGWSEEQEATDSVRSVLRSVHPDVEKQTNEKYDALEAISYKSQVVSGIKYSIKALATHKNCKKSHVHLHVFRPIRGPLELRGVQTNQPKDKPLEHF